MKTCDTCQHWREGAEWPGVSNMPLPGYHACMCPKVMDGTPQTDDGAYVQNGDYASSGAQFETGPKFGCIHHERK